MEDNSFVSYDNQRHYNTAVIDLTQVPETMSNSSITVSVGVTTMTPIPTEAERQCDKVIIEYQVAPAIICAICFIFGIVYTFFGYRLFKVTMFLTGFLFGSLVTYLICSEEQVLPLEGKIGVALTAGVLCGLITMLVQYVGLFMTGFHFGVLVATAALIILEQFYHPTTKWIPIGVLFGTGLLFAILALYFQKGLTILGTSVFGAALMVVGIDYYTELHMMVIYVWERLKAEKSKPVCWFSWIILGLWPAAFMVGAVVQWRKTGKNFDHQEAAQNKAQKRINLQRLRLKERRDAQHSRYRHLYQIRRSNGDVISQGYVRRIHDDLSPAMQSLAQDSESASPTDTPIPLTEA